MNMANGRICKVCGAEITREKLDSNLSVCPFCGNYMRFHAYKRIRSLADEHSFHEWKDDILFSNPLNDRSYEELIGKMKKKHNLKEAIVAGEMKINGSSVAIGVMDTRFIMASMGRYVGEKITCMFEKAMKKRLPVIVFCCSGGARMQEGIISLMQMEKTAAAVKKT